MYYTDSKLVNLLNYPGSRLQVIGCTTLIVDYKQLVLS